VYEPEFQSTWEASINAIDLAWEMGTLQSGRSSAISNSFTSPQPRRQLEKRTSVRFSEHLEFYVGFEHSRRFARYQLPLFSFSQHAALRGWLQDPNAGFMHISEDEDATDEVSWMSAHVPRDQGAPLPFQNRDAAVVADLPAAAHQEDHMEIEVEVEIEDQSSSSESEVHERPQEMRHSTMVFFMDRDPMHCRPRWCTYEDLHRDITAYSSQDAHDIARVHVVGQPPEDLQMASVRPVIVQQPQDVTEGSTFQLVLLDVDFHNAFPSLEAETVRRVKLLPQTISRKALIAVLGLQPYCTYARKTCLVWHNRHPVKTQSKALLDLRHGDYVKLAVPPGRGDLRQQYTRDVAQCMRRGYRASNIPVLMEAFPQGIDVADMPVIDTFNLDYDRDAMTLMQISGPSRPSFDPWPTFLTRYDKCEDPFWQLKVGEEDRVESRILTTSEQAQLPGGGVQLRFGNEIPFLQEFHPFWAHFAAVEVEEEGRVLYIQTWFSDHERFPTCERARPVRLLADPWSWLETIAAVWDDRVDPDSPIDFFVIFPQPRSQSWDPQVGVQHILLVQHSAPDKRSVHISSVDTQRPELGLQMFVTAAPYPICKLDFFDILGISDRRFVSSLVDCAVWHGDHELDHVQRYPTRHGLSFIVIRNHLHDVMRRAAAASSASSSHSLSLLQVKAEVQRKRTIIALSDLLPEGPAEIVPDHIIVRVKWFLQEQPHPDFLTLPQSPSNIEVEQELQHWGLHARAILCLERDCVLCLPMTMPDPVRFDYFFVNMDTMDAADILAHSSDSKLSEMRLMQVLYQLGYWRAVIMQQEEVHPQVFKILFKDQKVITMKPPTKPLREAVWPPPQSRHRGMSPFFHPPTPFDSDQLVDIGVTVEDMQDFFNSHQDSLRSDLDGYELPEEIQTAINACDQSLRFEEIDRLLIYADGSSMGCAKHTAPQRAEEEGVGDTWAYVVLGERYQPPGLRFIGWSAHPVIYEEGHNYHIGAKRVGADIAEKEALTWAALWRLSQNWAIPTCFRSDSRVSLGQAEGTTGSAQIDDSLVFLRGSFQALEAALGPDGVLYAHVPGHVGEVWNELCDWLAKSERQKSHYCPRPSFEVTKWSKAIAHLWMILRPQADLPPFCGHGLHAPAPTLPARHPVAKLQCVEPTQWDHMRFTFSACTANVQSLCAPPEGHGGKIDFLRRQFVEFGFNFLGIQESKTDEFCSCVDDVYRLSAGHHNHQQGVELWINLKQPYGFLRGKPQFFARGDFQVAHRDPRVLLVRVDSTLWQGWVLVGYAPQSGLAADLREQWWQSLSEILCKRQQSDPLIAMLDANAAPGEFDGEAIWSHGLPASSSTPFFRRFVAEQDLFLPCTTSCHRGAIETWTDPAGLKKHCIDYVLLSSHFSEACVLSQVVTEFDLGTSNWDHEATAVEFTWTSWVPHGSHGKGEGLGFDHTIVTADTVKEILIHHEPAAWETNIEDHVQGFTRSLLDGLRERCPMRKSKPKKRHITPEIWALREQKLHAKKRLKNLAVRQREESLGVIFRSWRGAGESPTRSDSFQRYHNAIWIHNLHLVATYRRAAHELRKQLCKAKQNALKDTFEAMDANAPASQVLHELKPILGPTNLKKLKTNTLPHVRNAAGETCSLPNEAVEVWLEFFREMEGGVRMDHSTQRAIWIQNLARLRQDFFTIDASELPRLLDLEAAYRRINPTKAVGPDKLHPAVCRAHPPSMARQTFSQLWKLSLHGQEDLSHKGGILHPIWKSKGPKDRCEAYRSILVSSFVGKSLHRCIRQRQTSLFERFLQAEQLGGRPTVPVTLGVHLGRSFVRDRHSRGHNIAMLFIDLTEVFYRILRTLVTGEPADDELIMKVGKKMGFTEDLMQELYVHLAEPAALASAGLPAHMQNAIKALHVDTHFAVRGQADVCRTALGSRPGDCFADVIFSYLWGRILHRFQASLKAMDIDEQIPKDGGLRLRLTDEAPEDSSCSFLGPTWMDDTCICVSDPDSNQLERKIHQAKGRLLELCTTHGLTPNLGPGKTEVLLIFQGKGSRQQKIKYFGPNSDKTLKIVGEKGIQAVRVVQHYTHLGCILHHKQDNRREARRRIGMAQQTFSQHRRHLLQNPALSLTRRVELFKTLVWSRFCFGTESWVLDEKGTKEYVHNALVRLFKRLIKAGHDAHLTDDDVLVETGLNSPTELLRLSRLRYIGTLYRCGPRVPWGLINSDHKWTTLVADDLNWLWHQLQNASTLPDPAVAFGVWEDLWLHHPSYWRRLVRRGGEHAILQRRRRHRVECFHQSFAQCFQQLEPQCFGDDAFGPVAEERARDEEVHACMTCRCVFKSRGGLGAHLFKRHGIPSRLRLLFDSTSCGHCLKEYHTFSKLQAHLRHSQTCREHLWGRRHRFTPSSGTGSTIDRSLCLAHDGLLPPLQAAGPRQEEQPAIELPAHDLRLAEEIYLAIIEDEGQTELRALVCGVVERRVTSWTIWCATIDYMLEIMTEADIEVLNVGDIDIRRLLRGLQQVQEWAFLVEERCPRGSQQRPTLEAVEQGCLHARASASSRPRLWEVPRPMAKERFVIHAFSGRRRPGDFQFFLDEAQANFPEVTIFTISVDLMTDPLWGDVSRASVREFWLTAVRQRQVVGALAGPPCETWSQARGRELPGAEGRHHGPRVVRDIEELWGRAALALKEVRQLDIGNLLLLFVLELLINLAITGGIGGLEHPAPPADPLKASIWRLPLMLYLLEWPEFQFLEISQGLWGAPSRKPTGLLLLNLEKMIPALRSWQLTLDMPKGTSIGLNADGDWATGVLKEYPPALCAGLASGFLSALHDHKVDAHVEISPAFRRQALNMVMTTEGACIGPDYAV
jgi:hypothetical protein